MTPPPPLHVIRFAAVGDGLPEYAAHAPGHTFLGPAYARKFATPADALAWLESVRGRYGDRAAEVVPFHAEA